MQAGDPDETDVLATLSDVEISQLAIIDEDTSALQQSAAETHFALPYEIEMYARYLSITLKDPQNNIPPSLVAGMFAVMGTMICEFSMYKALEGYSEWQKDQLHFLFTPLNSLFWCAVYFLLETGEPIDLEGLFNDPDDR